MSLVLFICAKKSASDIRSFSFSNDGLHKTDRSPTSSAHTARPRTRIANINKARDRQQAHGSNAHCNFMPEWNWNYARARDCVCVCVRIGQTSRKRGAAAANFIGCKLNCIWPAACRPAEWIQWTYHIWRFKEINKKGSKKPTKSRHEKGCALTKVQKVKIECSHTHAHVIFGSIRMHCRNYYIKKNGIKRKHSGIWHVLMAKSTITSHRAPASLTTTTNHWQLIDSMRHMHLCTVECKWRNCCEIETCSIEESFKDTAFPYGSNYFIASRARVCVCVIFIDTVRHMKWLRLTAIQLKCRCI